MRSGGDFAGRHGHDYGYRDHPRDRDLYGKDRMMSANDPRMYYNGSKDNHYREYYTGHRNHGNNRQHRNRGAYRNPQKLYFARRGGLLTEIEIRRYEGNLQYSATVENH